MGTVTIHFKRSQKERYGRDPDFEFVSGYKMATIELDTLLTRPERTWPEVVSIRVEKERIGFPQIEHVGKRGRTRWTVDSAGLVTIRGESIPRFIATVCYVRNHGLTPDLLRRH